jgi:hypothetical protein
VHASGNEVHDVDLRLLFASLSFFIVLISGIWLTRAGKPYSALLLNVHKLISLAGVVLLALFVRQQGRVSELPSALIAVNAVSGLLLVASIVTGGLVSVDRPMPRTILFAHRVMPFLSLAASAVAVYLLLSRP